MRVKIIDDSDVCQEREFGEGANGEDDAQDEGVWEARGAVMALVNALTNCPESLEERVTLREEFGRRGLNEVIVVRARLSSLPLG